MLKKILFPIDFSSVTSKALEFIKQMKKLGAEEVVVLNVIEDKYLYFLDEFSSMSLERFDKDVRQNALNRISPFAAKLYDAGYKVKVMTVRGAAAREILKAEQSENVSITVLGSQSVGCFREMFQESVAEILLRKSRQPVVIVKDSSRI